MGWCQEFGLHVKSGCDHAMLAGTGSCSCPECVTTCTGRFAGCALVWATAKTAKTAKSGESGESAPVMAVEAAGDGVSTNGSRHTAVLAASLSMDEVLHQIDTRFAWLTRELSDRLVVLGNEIAAIKKQLESGGDQEETA